MFKKYLGFVPQIAVECLFFVTIIVMLTVTSNAVGIS